MKNKYLKLLLGFALTAAAGFLLGVLVQLGSTAAWYSRETLLGAFGTVSIGFFFWIAVCTPLSFRARCGLHASLLTLSLLIPMLTGYIFAAYAFYGYLNNMLVTFGVVMLMPAAGAAWLLRAYRDRRWMRILVRLAGISAFFFDMQARGTYSFRALTLSLPLLVLFLYVVHEAGQRAKQRERRQSAADTALFCTG